MTKVVQILFKSIHHLASSHRPAPLETTPADWLLKSIDKKPNHRISTCTFLAKTQPRMKISKIEAEHRVSRFVSRLSFDLCVNGKKDHVSITS